MRQRPPFPSGIIGKKNKTLLTHFFQQHHARAGALVFIDRGDIHRSRLVHLRGHGFVQPLLELRDGMVGTRAHR